MISTSREFDVLVVGGGPAGLSAAAAAAEKDLRVAILEKDLRIGDKIRTSGVTWLPEIDELGIPRDLYNPIRKFGVYFPNREHLLEMSQADACVLDVRKLWQYLANQARSVGTEIFLGTKAIAASYEAEGAVKVTAESASGRFDLHGSIVIDASGLSSVVARSLGLVKDWVRFGIGAEYEAYAEKVETDTLALMIGQQYSPAGYAWIFPVGENRVRIGVGIGRPESNRNPLEHLTYLLEKRPGPLGKLGKVSPIEYHYGLVPGEGPRTNTVSGRVLLVGDSAGHVNPLLLEGIRFSIKFGRIAGHAAKYAIESASTKALNDEYEKKWKGEVWSNFQVGVNVQKKWLEFSDKQWDKEAFILDVLSPREFLRLLRCEFSTNYLLKLVGAHPALLKSKSFLAILQGKISGFAIG
jgi:digeranylgeranylglycerophospholipid reductase